jgi:O-antigen ligase
VWVVASALVLPAAMLWGAPPKFGEGYRLVKAIRRSFIFVALGLALAMVVFPQAIGARLAFYRETILLDSPDSETLDRAWNYPVGQFLLAFSDSEWLIGHGIGTASLGGQYVSRILEVPTTNVAVESGYGALLLELGIVGLVLWLGWTLSLIFGLYKVMLRLKGTWAFPVAFSIFWFAFVLLFPLTWGGLAPYQNFVMNAYLWLLVGVLFRLPALVAGADDNSPQSTADSRQ